MKIKIYQIDAFTDELFKGNPAAVCPLDERLDEELMQAIAAENNLSETAFIVKAGNDFEIRWFTPDVEVDLCGHATLASAFVVFNELGYKGKEVTFRSKYKGNLRVVREGDLLVLYFPAEACKPVDEIPEIEKGIGVKPISTHSGETKIITELETEEQVRNLKLDFTEIAKLDKGLIVTAPGKELDFVSRFFVPQYGINEDPVTGSAHTLLVPFWSKKLGKTKLLAHQVSKRGGFLFCENLGMKVKIAGKARLFLRGEIFIDE